MRVSRLLAMATIVAAAACGSSTGNPPPPPPPPPPGPPPPPPPPPGNSTTITVANNSFSPTPDTISVGNITFHWATNAVTHNVTWDTGPSSPTDSGDKAGGDPDYVAALVAGNYTYHCTHHGGMNGTIHVNP